MMIILRVLTLLVIAWPLAGAAQTDGAQIAFGSMKADPTLPVEVTSDRLNVNQAKGTAIFTGNVIAIQGKMRLTAPKVEVQYAADRKSIESLHGTGGVTLTNAGESAEGAEAFYTVATGSVLMTGKVLLTQGTSAIAGDKLTVDLNTGTGVMTGRVQSVFIPGSIGPAP